MLVIIFVQRVNNVFRCEFQLSLICFVCILKNNCYIIMNYDVDDFTSTSPITKWVKYEGGAIST